MADEEDEIAQQPIYDDEEPEGGIFRWMSALVVLLAVAGFFGLAWYAYRNGGETVDEKDVELVKADKTPVKEAPANPGGMQIPNQDKTVYGLISGKTEKPVVERILPAPEEPMARGNGGDTETWMSESLKSKTNTDGESVKIAQADSAGAPDNTAMPAPKEQFNPKAHAVVASVTTPSPTPTPAASPSPSPSAAPVAAKPVALPPIPPVSSAPVKPPVVAATPAPAAKPFVANDADDADDDAEKRPDTAKPAPPPGPVPPAGVRVQLGSYKSQGEAESNWKKIAQHFSDDVKGKQHYVVRADLGPKGVFYRLQLAPFDSAGDAEQFCLDFVSAGQGCIATKGK